MNSLLTRVAILTACLTLSGCVFSGSTEKPGDLTKDDAQNITNPGEDLCDLYNWYGDGQCDTFCENPDPDCDNAQCDDTPVCSDGLQHVTECGPGECTEVSLCGQTILCSPPEVCSNDEPEPTCDSGYELVDVCVTGDCQSVGGYCGAPEQFCQLLCEPIGGCPPNTHQVDDCAVGQDCVEEPICDFVIYCAPDAVTCDAIPVCTDGYTEVESCPADTNCYNDTLCGKTISCLKDGCSKPLTCAADSYLVQSCAPNTVCYLSEVCGTAVACTEGSIGCLVPPECPEGTTAVQGCNPNRTCNEYIECGIRLYCDANSM